jgi:hypothetical protein
MEDAKMRLCSSGFVVCIGCRRRTKMLSTPALPVLSASRNRPQSHPKPTSTSSYSCSSAYASHHNHYILRVPYTRQALMPPKPRASKPVPNIEERTAEEIKRAKSRENKEALAQQDGLSNGEGSSRSKSTLAKLLADITDANARREDAANKRGTTSGPSKKKNETSQQDAENSKTKAPPPPLSRKAKGKQPAVSSPTPSESSDSGTK